MVEGGSNGGNRFENKSLRAVATAFTGMSRSLMLIPGSVVTKGPMMNIKLLHTLPNMSMA